MIETPTLNSRLSSARLCAANGWEIETVLHAAPREKEGDRMNRVIRITAVGEQAILAREWEWATGQWAEEMGYNLTTRQWRREVERERALRCAGRGVRTPEHGGPDVREGAPIPPDAPPRAQHG